MSVCNKINFGRTWGLSGLSDNMPADFRPISAEFWILKFQKSGFFALFWLFFALFLTIFWPFSHFFSKWYFGGKMSPRTQKMTFLAFFSSSSWFISIFWWFLMFQKFEFFNTILSFSLFSCTFQLKSCLCFDYYLEW